MFKRLLIANRGEIAVRIIRCCREMEIEPVAVYSTADRDALHVQLASRAVCIGPPRAADSYLNKQISWRRPEPPAVTHSIRASAFCRRTASLPACVRNADCALSVLRLLLLTPWATRPPPAD